MWTATSRARHNRAGLRFANDLTDAKWAVLQPLLPPQSPVGRRPRWPVREIVNAIFYVLRGGMSWRMLPPCFPPRQTVYGWFASLRDAGVWQTINHHLVDELGLRCAVVTIVPSFLDELNIARASDLVALVTLSCIRGEARKAQGLQEFDLPVPIPELPVSAMWHRALMPIRAIVGFGRSS